jgi:hypothetical protein
MKEEELVTARPTLVKLATQIASEDYGIELDFSEASLGEVDRILLDLHKQSSSLPDGETKLQGLQGIALEMAAYVVEIIEAKYGKGVWKRNSKEFGVDSWPYSHNDITIFPVAWCMKCIVNGSSDRPTDKYRQFINLINDRPNKA